MENLQDSIHLTQELEDNIKLLQASPNSLEYQLDIHHSLSKSVHLLKENLQDCHTQMKGSYQIMDNLLRERDVLLAKSSMTGVENTHPDFQDQASNLFSSSG